MQAIVSVAYPWFAVRVKPNCERIAAAGLTARNIEAFLPTYTSIRQWSDRLKTSERPLFPGYVFCRLDPEHRVPVLQAPGVVGMVCFGHRLLPVDEHEIEAVRCVIRENIPTTPVPFLETGRQVRVMTGALSGIEGLVLENRGGCYLVLQISLLQRAIRVQIDRDWIEPLVQAF